MEAGGIPLTIIYTNVYGLKAFLSSKLFSISLGFN